MENLEIIKTYNYDMFKKLVGNRVINERRVSRIVESIKRVGYVINPIIVNQNYEVIDGQGRLEALKRLELPVYYIKIDNLGLNECVSMNVNHTNWVIGDYLESYAVQGIPSYQILLDLSKKHKVSYKVICFAMSLKSRFNTTLAKEGGLEFSKEEIERAQERLSYLDTFKEIKKLNGGLTFFQQALIFCYQHEGVDPNRLREKIEEGYAYMLPWKDAQTAVESIEDIYNRGLSAERKLFLGSDFRKLMLKNMSDSSSKENSRRWK